MTSEISEIQALGLGNFLPIRRLKHSRDFGSRRGWVDIHGKGGGIRVNGDQNGLKRSEFCAEADFFEENWS